MDIFIFQKIKKVFKPIGSKTKVVEKISQVVIVGKQKTQNIPGVSEVINTYNSPLNIANQFGTVKNKF